MTNTNQIFSANTSASSEANLNNFYNFHDLDDWVGEASGTPEYIHRTIVAQQIKDCHESNSISLDILNAEITSLPNAIGNLRNLRSLSIDHDENGMGITELPAGIWNLIHLESFSIQGTPFLSSLDPDIGNFHNLNFLEIGDTQIQTIPPEIGNLTNLRNLTIRDSQLTVIPPQLGNLINLRELNIAGNPNLTYIPFVNENFDSQNFLLTA